MSFDKSKWATVTLSEVADIIMGQSPSSINYTTNPKDTILIQGNADILNGKITPRVYTTEITKICEIGDIIMSVRAPVGDIAITDYKACLGRGVCAITSQQKYNQSFLYYVFEVLKITGQWKSISTGSTFESVNSNEIRRMPIPLPPLGVQEQIANLLSKQDELIYKLSSLIKLKEKQFRGLVQRLISEPTERGEWESATIREVAECLDTKRIPLNQEERNSIQGTIPYYGANGIVDYVNQYIFDEPLILLAEDGGYFDEYATRPIAQLIKGKSWVNNHAHVLKAKHSTEFFYFAIMHKNISNYIQGSSRAKLNQKDMMNISMPNPPLKEQERISRILSLAQDEIDKLKALKNTHLQQKKGLMQVVFG